MQRPFIGHEVIPELKPRLCDEKPACNHMNHDKAVNVERLTAVVF
jgi:hypothetical protein